MATSGNAGTGSSSRVSGAKRKYTCYDEHQIAALETVFALCPHPCAAQRLEMKQTHPVLSCIDDKQIKIWFQNRRNREKQKKDSADLNSGMEKLTVTNKYLKDENDSLMKKVTELLSENDYLRQQLHDVC